MPLNPEFDLHRVLRSQPNHFLSALCFLADLALGRLATPTSSPRTQHLVKQDQGVLWDASLACDKHVIQHSAVTLSCSGLLARLRRCFNADHETTRNRWIFMEVSMGVFMCFWAPIEDCGIWSPWLELG